MLHTLKARQQRLFAPGGAGDCPRAVPQGSEDCLSTDNPCAARGEQATGRRWQSSGFYKLRTVFHGDWKHNIFPLYN